MKVGRTATHWSVCMTVGELQSKYSEGELLFLGEDRLEWGAAGTVEGVPVMDAQEFFWYATDSWHLQARHESDTHIKIQYPRVTLDLCTATPGRDVTVQGVRYRLLTQSPGVSEKDLLARGCLPTDRFEGYDQLYAEPVSDSTFLCRGHRAPEDA